MTQPSLYMAVTAHGFGHAVRVASVAAKVQELAPDILLTLVTQAPRWLLESYIPGDFMQRARAFDVGVIQSDSINMDRPATLEKLREIRAKQHSIIATEADYIRTNKIKLVLADIPFLAAPIAKVAGIPCWMMSNFGWDFIYRDWGGEFNEIADWIGDCYAQCDRLFRLPLHEAMSAFPNITDVGLTGGTPQFSKAELRAKFQLEAPSEKLVLLTFGGLGLQEIPYHNLQGFPDWQFIAFDRAAPDFPNLIKIRDRAYRPVDFMPLCGRVVSKPGYSTFAEALRLNAPIVSLKREGFAESPLLLEGLQNHARHQLLTTDEFFQGSWDFLHAELSPPRQSTSLPADGTETIARALIDYCRKG